MRAAKLLGGQIRVARKRRGMTIGELAERVGVTPRTITKIESGDPHVVLAAVFDAATLTGVALFGADEDRRRLEQAAINDQLTLLPKRVRERQVNTDF
jgi:transcriptional regulator with XRE-family HTH domain